jgi:uncharacterized membrane protein (DUF2068 family)
LSETSSQNKKHGNRLIRLISVVKLFKVLLLFCLSFGFFKLLNPDVSERLTHWIGTFAWNYSRSFVLTGLGKLTGLEPVKLKALGIAAFLYALLFAVEGIGLWFEKRWAEYLTVIATGSLIPLELYEVINRFTFSRGVTLLLNLLVLIYLISVVRRKTS